MNRSLAQFISYLLHPAIYPILGVFLILQTTPQHITFKTFAVSLSVVFAGSYLIPVLVSLLLFQLRWISSLSMTKASDRRFPYLVGALCYYLVAEALRQLPVPSESYYFILGSALIVVLHLFLLKFMKPSAHLAGIGGFTALTLFLSLKYAINFLPVIAACFILSGFVASARLRLQAHTNPELVVGYFTGFLIIGTMCFLS